MSEPYNPLSKLNLAKSIEGEILRCPLMPIENIARFEGAGIYALYYRGFLPFYQSLTQSIETGRPRPIYVGKAIPEGGRTGGLGLGVARTTALYSRLRKHARSIAVAEDFSLADFLVKYLVVDDIWIPLGENALIETYAPVWNKVVAGFGNNPPGEGRKNQKVSLWDILHPGRSDISVTQQAVQRSELQNRVTDYFAGKAVPEVDSRDPDSGSV